MKIKRLSIRIIAAISSLLVFGTFGAQACFAYSPRAPIANIENLEQLLAWHNEPFAGFAQLTNNIEINGAVELAQTEYKKGLNTFDWQNNKNFTLRIMPGASLTVDNSKIELGGFKEIFAVESTGVLKFVNGRFDASHNESSIIVKSGGSFILDEGFIFNGNVLDEALPEPPEDTRTPIKSLLDNKSHISCAIGEIPDQSQFPTTIIAYFDKKDAQELPIEWDISTVDFTKPALYTVKGYLSTQMLDDKNLSNPNNLTAVMTILVYKIGETGELRGEVLSVGSKGNTVARMAIATLPVDQLTAVYLHISSDGVNWSKATRNLPLLNGVTPTSENFLSNVTTVGPSSYIPYHYKTDYNSLWVKIELVGSNREGISNAVQLILPEGASPGDKTENDSTEDAGESGGNRGGGGQTETDRVISPAPAPIAPIESAPTSDTLQDTAYEQELNDKASSSLRENEKDNSDAASNSSQQAEPVAAESPEQEQRERNTNLLLIAAIAAAIIGICGLGLYIFLKRTR